MYPTTLGLFPIFMGIVDGIMDVNLLKNLNIDLMGNWFSQFNIEVCFYLIIYSNIDVLLILNI